MKGIILFGHGSRNPEWAKPFHTVQQAIQLSSPDMQVELGFLEAMRPTFDEAIQNLVGLGVTNIRIVPIFLATGNHIAKDLPKLVADAMERYPQARISITAPIGESSLVIDAIARYAVSVLPEFDD